MERPDGSRRLGWSVFLLALAVRLLALAELIDVPLFRTPQLDSLEYSSWARRLAEFEPAWSADLPHGPGYPLFLAALLVVSGGSLLVARAVQAAVGAATCWLVFRIAQRTYGPAAGAAAGTLCALYAPLILVDVSILAEGLLLFLLTASCWLALRAGGSTGRTIASGLLLGAAVVVRPTAVVAAPVLLFLVWKDSSRRPLAVGAFCIAAALPILPVSWINWQHGGGVLPVQAKSGFNVYQALSPRMTGMASLRAGGGYEALAAEAARRGLHGSAADRYYVRKAAEEIAAAPRAFLRLLGTKCVWMVQNVELRDSHSFYFFREQSRVLQWGLPFAVLFALGAAGTWAAASERRIDWPILTLLLAFGFTLVALLVGSRYRMPLVPFLAVLGGAGLAAAFEWVMRKRFDRLLAFAVVAACAFALAFVWDHPASREFAEEWTYTAQSLVREGRPMEARSAYQRALEADPGAVRALAGLASLALREGNRGEAGRLVFRALGISRRDPSTHFVAGEVSLAGGDPRAAAAHFGMAARILPDWIEAGVREAEALASVGRLRAAASAYARVTGLLDRGIVETPGQERARAHLRLAELLLAQGRAGEALPSVRRSIAVDDGNGRAWLVLAMTAMSRGDRGTAGTALARAEALGALREPMPRLSAARLKFQLGEDAKAMALVDSLPEEAKSSPAATALRQAISRRRGGE